MTTPTATPANEPAFAPRPSWIQGQVAFHEQNHGPLPDVVATQGQYLVAQPHTPVFPPLRSETEAFATELTASLGALTSRQNRRRLGYGVEAAEEWPIGRTPPKVRRAQKERLRAKLRASLEEDSESDIEAVLDSYYPLSPVPSESQGSPSSSFAIDPKTAIVSRDGQIDSENDFGKKRKLEKVEEAHDHAGDTEHTIKKTKAEDVSGADDGPQTSMVEDLGSTDGVLERPDSTAAPKSHSEMGDGSCLQRTAERHSSPTDNAPSAVTTDTPRRDRIYRLGRAGQRHATCSALEEVVHGKAGGQNKASRPRATRPHLLSADEEPKKRVSPIESQRGSKEKDSSPTAGEHKAKQSRKIHERGRGDSQKKKPPRRHGRAPTTSDEMNAEPLEKADVSLMAQEAAKVIMDNRKYRKKAPSHDTQSLRRSERLRRKQGFAKPPD
ncbi:hypothetical protein INS49_008997 [Diaporthe citri]|uniref:uncharacterized protein n=1 Tax=Diaporthe citri TaxID=83186 RepID=UPI001C8079AA|nr:uncharacterized protein INS49_008997 [Diaporthe citri]KAG6363894.1 hypothetical protein INS49_008997 [Diaporthe citri]